ncbi:MAG: hypothetical protein LBU88_10965 [Treponema sp.]|jgi:hypothetical protein|nr:hypothetical protein [Treponema sp.]
MAIAPIDLQTLFTQLDKAGRMHMTQRETQPIQQAIQAVQTQKKTEEQINQINETQDTGDGAEKVNDQGRDKGYKQSDGKERKKNEEAEEERKKILELSDPALGKKIDISL